MKKIVVSVIAAATLLSAGIASAQVYYSGSYAGTSSCITLTRNLSIGMRGSDVSQLQSFLVSRNYRGSGSWMITGYFGRATQAAVQIYQKEKGIPQTGVVDVATRGAIAACGSAYNPYPTYPTYPSYPTYPTYPTYPQYPSYGQVQITSLSPNSAAQGASVTIYGSGFDYSNNTVYVGSQPVSNVASYNGTSLTFTVPTYVTGSVQVYVANSRGSSNALTLSVLPYQNPCSYPYNYGTNCGGCTYYSQGCTNGAISIQYLSPNSGAVGSTVTVYGTGFSTTGNTVRFGNGIITNLSSNDGRSVSFTIPTQLVGYNSQPVQIGNYPVSVTNSSGFTSNEMMFSVTSLGTAQAPTITSVNGPTSIAAGQQGTWTVQTYNPPQNYSNYITISVRWGDETLYGVGLSAPQQSYAQGSQTSTFTHTYTQAGTYTITFTVTNAAGQSNISTVTVSVGGSTSGQTTITSISPVSGRVGTQVIITGSGFNTYDNTVRFGIGGTMHVPSYNGNTIYFTIPSYVSQCDVMPGTQCFYAQPVSAGQYQVSVSNGNNTSNQLTFTVTQ